MENNLKNNQTCLKYYINAEKNFQVHTKVNKNIGDSWRKF